MTFWIGTLIACHDSAMLCDHRDCGGGDIVFSVCLLSSRNQMFKGSCNFISGRSSQCVTIMPCLVAIGLVEVEI